MHSSPKILVVDDDPMVRELIADLPRSWGYEVVAEPGGREALESFTKQGPWQLIILDLRMPGMNGLELLEKIRESDPRVESIIVTAYADIESAIQAIGLGVFDYLTKPIVPKHLKHRVEKAIERHHLGSRQKELLRELEERIRQRTRELEAMKDIAVCMIGPNGLKTLLDFVLARVLEALGDKAGMIHLVDEERGELVPMASRGLSQEMVEDLVQRRIRIGEELCGQVAERGEPVFIPMNASGDPRITRASIKISAINSYLSVPLKSRERVVGVFSVVGSIGETSPLSTKDLEFVATIGHQLGVAIENARLFEESRRKTQKLSALNQISQIMTSRLNRREVFDFIVQAAVELLEASVSTLWVLGDTGEVRLQANVGLTTSGDRGKTNLKVGEGLVDSIIKEKAPVVLFDYQGDPRHVKWPWVQAEGLRAFAGIPLLLDGKCLGVLTVAWRTPRLFSEDEVELLISFANQVAIAIENARLFQDTSRSEALWENTFDSVQDLISIQDGESRLLKVNKALAGKLKAPQDLIGRPCSEVWCGDQEPGRECPLCQALKTGQPLLEEVVCPHLGGTFLFSAYPLLDRRGEVFGSIHIARDITKRREMEEQVRHSDKLAAVGQLAVGLAHEIGNAIAIIGGATQFLIKNTNTERDHPSREFLEVIDRSVTTADCIIRDLLSFARPRPPILQLLEVRTILDRAFLLVKGRCEAGGIRIQKRHVQTPLQIQGDAEQLEQVFVNLILNAVQAMSDGGMLSLAASVDAEGEWVRIEIADTGVGIPPEYLDRIFDPFFTTKEGGTGLGLSVSYRIVQVHGGRITVESQEGRGTRLTISLPASRPGGRPCQES